MDNGIVNESDGRELKPRFRINDDFVAVLTLSVDLR